MSTEPGRSYIQYTDDSILYACVLEAQCHGSNEIMLKTLTQVLDKLETSPPPNGADVPALIR